MRISLPLWTAGLAISSVPTVSAFYPYVFKNGVGSSNSGKVRREPLSAPAANEGSITLPLRRVPRLRRDDNIYNIVKSDDPKHENSVAIDQDGSAEGVGYDRSYMVGVTIGDSKQEYHLLLDSAASNTWIMGQSCKTDACGKHSLLGRADSGSLDISDTPFNVTYGTGSVKGVVASDTVHIGPLKPKLSFGLATDVTDEFSSFPMDGIIGIGRGTNTEGTLNTPHVLDVLQDSNVINAKLYGVHLHRGASGAKDGELNFGTPNKDRYDGDLNYLPLVDNEDGFWEIKIDDAGIDGQGAGVTGRSAIVDTGTAFIFMPPDDAKALHSLVPGFEQDGENSHIPCDAKQSMWFEFGGQKYNISTADWVGGKLDGGMCQSNIIGRQTFGENQWLVGDVFLKNVYTVFDFDNEQVGFGVKGEEEEQSSTSASSGTATATPTKSASSTSGAETTEVQSARETQSPKAQDATGSGTAAAPSPTGGATHKALSSLSLVFYFTLGMAAWCI